MKKKYSVLFKKVLELEAELNQLFSLPHNHDDEQDDYQTPSYQILLSQDIDQRFIFLKSLLSAEISSSSSNSSPNHKKKSSNQVLHHIVQRVNELESSFRDWVSQTASSRTPLLLLEDGDNNGNDDVNHDNDDQLQQHHQNDAVSGCSCVNNDVTIGEDDDVDGEDFPEVMKREEGKGRVDWGFGKYFGAMGVGFMVGVGLMGLVMVRFCGCFEYCCYYYYGGKLGVLPPT